MIDEIKVTLGCFDCGYNAHPAALDFDHLEEDSKIRSISDMIRAGASWTELGKEIDKCDIVCANCHRIRTYERWQARSATRIEEDVS